MGQLTDGIWSAETIRQDNSGRFQRKAAQCRNWITADGGAGPSGKSGFHAEVGRYHLYISYACPWAHRTLIMRKLKGLEKMISLSVVHWYMAENGWTFAAGPGVIPDPVNNCQYMHQIYTKSDPQYSGRASVPVLWDKQQNVIVSNESSEIIRMFNNAFDGIGAKPGDYYPQALRDDIDLLNDRIYNTVNNGVYKSGFSSTQEAYEAAVNPLFDTLDFLEQRLAKQRYLAGGQITEVDWRLFPTLVRFDPVYVGHFKCNRRRLVDYPNLWAYSRDLFQQPGIAGTVNFEHIKKHYYQSHESVNPTRIVPVGPDVDFWMPHGRA